MFLAKLFSKISSSDNTGNKFKIKTHIDFELRPAVFFADNVCSVWMPYFEIAKSSGVFVGDQDIWNALRCLVSDIRHCGKMRKRTRIISKYPTDTDTGSCYYVNCIGKNSKLGYAAMKKTHIEYGETGIPNAILRGKRIDFSEYDIFPTRIGSKSCPIIPVCNIGRIIRKYASGRNYNIPEYINFKVKDNFKWGKSDCVS